jgi:hypothetical protein
VVDPTSVYFTICGEQAGAGGVAKVGK